MPVLGFPGPAADSPGVSPGGSTLGCGSHNLDKHGLTIQKLRSRECVDAEGVPTTLGFGGPRGFTYLEFAIA